MLTVKKVSIELLHLYRVEGGKTQARFERRGLGAILRSPKFSMHCSKLEGEDQWRIDACFQDTEAQWNHGFGKRSTEYAPVDEELLSAPIAKALDEKVKEKGF